MKGKRIAITGGAGFIGSNLAEELATSNSVIIIDDLSTGKKENIASLLQKDEVRFIQDSILDLGLLQESLRGVDFVFHLAALPRVPRSIKDPLAPNEVNITGTLNVLLAARDNKVKKVIYSSSSTVYGDTPILPRKEDLLPCPQSPYAVTKLCAEYYCQVFQQVYRLNTVCLRYSNVYGPRQDSSSEYAAVIPRFISRTLQGKPPIIFGDGEQTRDFTFIKDTVEATILAAESNAAGVFNIGTGNRITINNLAKLVTKLLAREIKPIYQEPRPGDIRHSLADISKARQICYNPQYSLEEGLKATIREWHQ